ncbi:MAG: acyltransferase [Scytonema sp. RU_4_4]|nr:acyltransferase [Scytonema sp. RU_4_4]
MTEHLSHRSSSLEPSSHQISGRLFSLDLLKAMSMTAVVSFHSIIVPKTSYAASQLSIDLLFSPLRFCVPVFLTISFLLFERGLAKHTGSNWSAIQKRLMRLLIPTLFWFSITALLKFLNGNSWFEVIGMILTGEIFTGAYYLIVLLQFLPVFILLRRLFIKLPNVVLTILLQGFIFLYIYAIPSSPYHDQILLVLRTIDRPLFMYWFVYMALGVFLWEHWSLIVKISQQINIRLKIILFLSYCLIQMFEFYWFFRRFRGEIPPFDYVMFSCLLSVFIMVLCFASIQENQFPSFFRRIVSTISKYSLGIFCINGVLSQILISIGIRLFSEATFSLPEILILKLIVWILLLGTSLGLSILLDRIGLGSVVR